MFTEKFQESDEKIILWCQRWRRRSLTRVFVLFTWSGKGIFWWSIAIALNALQRFSPVLNPFFLKAFYAPLLVWAINSVLKRMTLRKRPSAANKNIVALVKEEPLMSFPSSHAGSTFSFFFILLWWEFPEAAYFGAWATIVSLSRMYLGVHFLTDVLAGILVGLIASSVIYLVF